MRKLLTINLFLSLLMFTACGDALPEDALAATEKESEDSALSTELAIAEGEDVTVAETEEGTEESSLEKIDFENSSCEELSVSLKEKHEERKAKHEQIKSGELEKASPEEKAAKRLAELKEYLPEGESYTEADILTALTTITETKEQERELRKAKISECFGDIGSRKFKKPGHGGRGPKI